MPHLQGLGFKMMIEADGWSTKQQFLLIMATRKVKDNLGMGLGAKRASLQADKLTGYGGEWQNDTNSTAFFKNMKNQLSNIKNDFERLIKKQGSLGSGARDTGPHSAHKHTPNTINNKLKSNSYRKEDRKPLPHTQQRSSRPQVDYIHYHPLNRKKEGGMGWTGDEWAPHALTQTTPAMSQLPPEVNTAQKEAEQEAQRQVRQNLRRNERENQRLQQVVMQLQNLVSRLQQDLASARKDNSQMRTQCENMRTQRAAMGSQRSSLVVKLEQLSQQLARKMEVVDLQEQKIQQMSQQAQQNLSHAQNTSQSQLQTIQAQAELRERELQEELRRKDKLLKDQIEHQQKQLKAEFQLKESKLNAEAQQRQEKLRTKLHAVQEELMEEGQQREKQLRAQYQKNEQKIRIEGQVAIKKAVADAQTKSQQQLQEAKRQWRIEMEQTKQRWQFDTEQGKRQSSDQAASQVRTQLQRQLEDVKRQWEEEVQQIRGRWGEEVKQVKQQCAQKIKDSRNNEQLVQNQAKENYEQQLAIISLRHSSQVDSLNSQIQHQRQEIQRLKSAPQSSESGLVLGMGQNEVRGLLQERDFLVRQLNGLGQHHRHLQDQWQKLCQAHQQLGEAHDQLNQQLQRKQSYIQDTQRLQAERDKDQQKRIEHLTQTLSTYNNRQEMFTQEIQKLQIALKSNPQSPRKTEESSVDISHLELKISQLQNENRQLREQLIGSGRGNGEFQLEGLITENQALKNQVNSLEAEMESQFEMNRAYKAQITLWQERERSMGERKTLNTTEWEEMAEKIDLLEVTNAQLKEQLDIAHLVQPVAHHVSDSGEKEQSQLHGLQQNFEQQLEEVEGLRDKLREQQETIVKLQREAQVGRVLSSGEKGMLAEIERGRQKVEALKEVVVKVLVQKGQRWQQEGQHEQLLARLQQLSHLWQGSK